MTKKFPFLKPIPIPTKSFTSLIKNHHKIPLSPLLNSNTPQPIDNIEIDSPLLPTDNGNTVTNGHEILNGKEVTSTVNHKNGNTNNGSVTSTKNENIYIESQEQPTINIQEHPRNTTNIYSIQTRSKSRISNKTVFVATTKPLLSSVQEIKALRTHNSTSA